MDYLDKLKNKNLIVSSIVILIIKDLMTVTLKLIFQYRYRKNWLLL
jgi:hypothetical protein